MNQTQSIIVYRNPMEQQLWEGGYVGLFVGIAVVFILCVVSIGFVAEKVLGYRRVHNTNWAAGMLLALAAAATWAVFHFLPLLLI